MKSFSRLTKEELEKNRSTKPCCEKAEETGRRLFGANDKKDEHIDPIVIRKECCRRSLVRGAFLSCGTVIDPKKNYNLELVIPTDTLCRELKELLNKEGFAFLIEEAILCFNPHNKMREISVEYASYHIVEFNKERLDCCSIRGILPCIV